METKTCPKGCHDWKELAGYCGWWSIQPSDDGQAEYKFLGDTAYCHASHAELLPGGEVREMVPRSALEEACGDQGLDGVGYEPGYYLREAKEASDRG